MANSRFLILPGPDCPNLASRVLALCCERLANDWRAKKGKGDSLHCLLATMVMATLAGIVRGQRDLAAFASKLTPFQRRTLGSYRNRRGSYDHPQETTFQRVLAKLDAAAFERILIEWEIQRTGADGGDGADADDQIGSTPHVRDEQKAQLVSAQSLPSGRVLGTVAVGGKKQRDSRRKRVARPPWPSRRQARHARRASLLSTNPAPDPPRQRRGLPHASQRQAHQRERGAYFYPLEPYPVRGEELLGRVRQYWGIEGSLHQGLDVSCGEDASRVRNRNALLVRAAFCGGASFGLGPG